MAGILLPSEGYEEAVGIGKESTYGTGVAATFWLRNASISLKKADPVLPLAGTVLRAGWDEVGRFLGGSIRSFWARYPLERQLELWQAAGIRDVESRRLSLGGGVVVWGSRA